MAGGLLKLGASVYGVTGIPAIPAANSIPPYPIKLLIAAAMLPANSDDLGRFFDPHHPAVLRLLKMVCDNAHKNGVWVGICGELGADLELTETFLSIGIDELSVSPRSVLPLRQKIRETTIGTVKEKILADLFSDEVTL
jgi:signal transduction protein with GAF and PtsI domain